MRNSAQSHNAVSGLLTGFPPEAKTERVASVLCPAGLVRGAAQKVVNDVWAAVEAKLKEAAAV